MAEFHKDEAGWNHVLRSRSGPVGQHLEDLSIELVLLAKQQVGKKTLALMRSIDYTVEGGGGGLKATIMASNGIAMMHHEGTRPHIITPVNTKAMRFEHRGRIVYARIVRHPGTRPNRYLTDNLRKVIN